MLEISFDGIFKYEIITSFIVILAPVTEITLRKIYSSFGQKSFDKKLAMLVFTHLS